VSSKKVDDGLFISKAMPGSFQQELVVIQMKNLYFLSHVFTLMMVHQVNWSPNS